MSRVTAMPTILCVLDGWGLAPPSSNNGISRAHTPIWDRLLQTCPHGRLQASGLRVGLPQGQMGNSEVGHMTIGAGRVVLQDLPRIDLSLACDEESDHNNLKLHQHPKFIEFVQTLQKTGGTCHVMGLLSPGGVHAHQSHMETIIGFMRDANIPLSIHAILDGRDTPPQSASQYVQEFLTRTQHPLATLGGRYYAMDRDNRWDRIEKAYKVMALGQGPTISDPLSFLQTQYQEGIGDEFILPHCVGNYSGMKDSDGLFMINFRADRVRQILKALLLPNFTDFERSLPVAFAAALGMGEYSADITPFMAPLFPKEIIKSSLGSVVSESGLKQLRVAETEKYAHVTFFLNGGKEAVFPGEDRILIPSPNVATYDLKPEMSAMEVTDKIVDAMTNPATDPYSLIVVNYANTDMVGHTGIPHAIIQAVETIDECLGKLEEAVKKKGYALVITADHGNVEQMTDETTGIPHTAHTLNPVPLVVVNAPQHLTRVVNGELSDIAPTVLTLLGLPIPVEMTGHSLLRETEDDLF